MEQVTAGNQNGTAPGKRVSGLLREAIKLQAAKVEELSLRCRGMILRAPVHGRVTQILCRKGQGIVRGEAIAVVTEERAPDVVAYLKTGDEQLVAANSRVILSRPNEPARVAESKVLKVGPAVEQLPMQLWRDPRLPEFGRPVMISAASALALLPGEGVRIRFVGQ